VKGYSQ